MTVEELRKNLVELGLSQEEANNIKGKAALEAKLEELEEKPFEFEQEEESNDVVVEKLPHPSDPEWKDYIMQQFDQAEEVYNGCPTVDGLRRVVEKVFGPILESNAKVIQSPNKDNNYHAVVEHEIVIYRRNFLEDDEQPYKQIVTEVSDVRTDEQENKYTKYSAGYASTRAEGRALRKLLRLRKIVAAEEIDENRGFDDHINDGLKITQSQCMTINLICNRTNVNPWALLSQNCPVQVKQPKDLPFNYVREVIQYLNNVQRGTEEVPKYCVGYEPLTLD